MKARPRLGSPEGHSLSTPALLLRIWHLALACLSEQHLPLQLQQQMTVQQESGLDWESFRSLVACPIPAWGPSGPVVSWSLLLARAAIHSPFPLLFL